MGKIKAKIEKKSNWENHQLSESDFAYLFNVNLLKQEQAQGFDKVMSAFLALKAEALGYEKGANLQFDLTFEDTTRTLRIMRLTE